MRWSIGNRSSNIEDRRGQRFGGMGFGGLGAGGIILLIILSLVFKRDFFSLISGGEAAQAGSVSATPEEEHVVDFVSFVLDTTQSTWRTILAQRGTHYQDAKLVLFRDAVQSACGFAQEASGPFYCPGDHKVYIDLGFYGELRTRFGAPGDFAQAYVLAHEVGHHVQDELGLEARFRQAQERNPRQAKALSVRFELQADCLAGIWAHSTEQRKLLEAGDVDEAL